jgi:hypothetical protein
MESQTIQAKLTAFAEVLSEHSEYPDQLPKFDSWLSQLEFAGNPSTNRAVSR